MLTECTLISIKNILLRRVNKKPVIYLLLHVACIFQRMSIVNRLGVFLMHYRWFT